MDQLVFRSEFLGCVLVDGDALIAKAILPKRCVFEFHENRLFTRLVISHDRFSEASVLLAQSGYSLVSEVDYYCRAKVVSLFPDMPRSIDDVRSSDRQIAADRPFASLCDPCKGCEFRDYCCGDDCAKHGFPIDVPAGRFKNLSEAISYIREYSYL